MSREPVLILLALTWIVSHLAQEFIPDVHLSDEVIEGVALIVLGALIRWRVVSPASLDAAKRESHYAGRRAEKAARGDEPHV